MSTKIVGANFLEAFFNSPVAEQQDAQTIPTQVKPEQVQTDDGNYTVKEGDTLSRLSEKYGISQAKILHDNPQIKNPNQIYAGRHLTILPEGKTPPYIVKEGDTLIKIAREHHTTVGEILRANPGKIAKRDLIFVNQKLHLPTKADAPTPHPPHPTKNTTVTKQPTTKPTPTPTPVQTKPVTEKPVTQQPVTTNGVSAGRINIDEFLSPEKGSNAIAAIVIGNAEGNRYEDGKFTTYYYGHKDPGDGLWNLGSFSRANERFPNEPKARTPEEADRLHLQHMQKAKVEYFEAMKKAGLDPNNALLASTFLDASNQSERASKKMLAPENLAYIKEKGISVDIMKDWRLGGFVNLKTNQRWLNKNGNPVGGGLAKIANDRMMKKEGRRATEQEIQQTIRQDQGRRVDAMAKALKYMKLLTVETPSSPQVKVTPNEPKNKTSTTESTQKSDGVIFEKPNGGAVDILLPANGKGYVTYKNDGNDHYGTAQTVKALQTIAAKWNEKHPELKIQIGDMSRKGGGYFYPHGSHKKGIDADIRPFRIDGKLDALNAVADPQKFDRDKTREFIKLVKQVYPNTVILFNDKQLIKEGLTKHWEGHDNHLHIHFK